MKVLIFSLLFMLYSFQAQAVFQKFVIEKDDGYLAIGEYDPDKVSEQKFLEDTGYIGRPIHMISETDIPQGELIDDCEWRNGQIVVNQQRKQARLDSIQQDNIDRTIRSQAQAYLESTPHSENSIPELRSRITKIEEYLFGSEAQS